MQQQQPDSSEGMNLLESALPDGDGSSPSEHHMSQQIEAYITDLQAQGKQLASILANTPDIIARFDRNLRYLYVSPAIEGMTGIPAHAFLGKTHPELEIPQSLTSRWDQSLKQVFETGHEQTVKFNFLTASGSRHYHASFTSEFTEDHSVGSVLMICRDFTELQQATREIQQRLAEIELIYQGAPVGMSFVDPSFRYIRINDRLAEINGVAPEDHIGRTVQEVLPELANQLEPLYQQVIDSKSPIINLEMRGATPAQPGVDRDWLASYYPLIDNNGQVLGISAVVQEITERKQTEAKLTELLRREQAAREQAEAANRVKDEFLTVLSHELRTPLNPILGWTRMLKQRSYDAATIATALDTIERNAKLQTQLIEDLLDISCILEGNLRLRSSQVDLAIPIQAALETAQLAAEAKSIQLSAQLAPEPVFVKGDPKRLQQIVWNLLSNAMKFTPNGGQIQVSMALEEADPVAQITVCDTGDGIGPEFLPHVFERFRQADSSSTRQFGGLGLGLAIVRHLVELHGGTITAQSAGKKQGSTFIVKLPLWTSPEDIEIGKGDMNAQPLHHVEILVVDDDPDTQDLLRFLLEDYGAIVTVASSAQDALTAFNQSTFNLIVSDLGMPEMDGFALMKEIRAQSKGKSLPSIALTAYARDEDRIRAIESGFSDYIAKPVDPLELITLIDRYCKSGD